MGAMMRAVQWDRTVFGPVALWPQSLRTAVSMMLESRFAMVVAWGPDFRFFYNDRYRPILGTKHPASLGTPAAEIFPEVWAAIGPEFNRVRRGESFALDDWLLPLDRNGYLENCWFTVSYSPIRDETGGVGGLLAVVAETTGRVEGERRLVTLRDLARRASDATTPDQACINAARAFDANPVDVPFALIFLLSRDGAVAHRVSAAGIDDAHPANLASQTIGSPDDPWRLTEAVRSLRMVTLTELPGEAIFPGGPCDEPAHTAVLLPLTRPGLAHPYGVLVAGVSPRRALDERYTDFFELAADHIATAISNAVALDDARRRADALTEIDRAKTAFFSNVSHEFRTPLTLMLGPAEGLLADAHGPLLPSQREQVAILHRNAGRLSKLVNALLDFSRIEAGRAQASYRETDIAALTRELAGAFRSAIEQAGLQFEVACEPIDAPVFVDRDMWEKIVLNLLSNALKFTFAGSITIAIGQRDQSVQLVVRDSGVGIPEPELPRIFERFHRVEGTRSRTHEGSGIGLALTSELVRLHGGTISATSTVDAGSAFVVQIPIGRAHLPTAHVNLDPAAQAQATGAAPFIDEAIRWQPSLQAPTTPAQRLATGARQDRILIADDNADMRDYMRQLLAGEWDVTTVGDGQSALAAALVQPPDLIVTDVMMPVKDGFELLQALRSEARTRAVPVLMLSARAGEEARISGLVAGAEDYMTKPFSARELVARVRSLLALARARREAELQKQHLRELFMQAPTPIVILNGPEHRVELANPLTCQVWGRREEDVVGRPLLEALPELVGQPFKKYLDEVLTTGKTWIGKAVAAHLDRRGDGQAEAVYFNFVYAPLRDVDGRIEGVLVIAFDVTDEINARNEKDTLRAAAESANRTKDEFLAILGHELRNPLSPILTALHVMDLRGDQDGWQERQIIDRQVRHLMRLVDDLLDVSRIAQGKVDLRKDVVELADLVSAAVETTQPIIEHRQQHLTVDVPAAGLLVNGDTTRLTQVISNVVANAAKYTQPGGRIWIGANRSDDAVELRIKDNGTGISREMLPKVFDLFIQERQGLDRAGGGLGLGLSIVRSLVELHGGTVRALSDGPGKGSEIVITLPREKSHESKVRTRPLPAIGKPVSAGRRILVVDDHVDSAEMTAAALALAGYESKVAHDGAAAIELAKSFRPDVALLDLGLPGMDGYQLAQQFQTAVPQPPRLVAMTGYGQVADRDRTTAAGFDAHVVKPVDFDRLAEVLDGLLRKSS